MSVQAELLPVSVQNRRLCRSAFKAWGTAWIVAGLATFYFCSQQNRMLYNLQTMAAATDAAAAPVRELKSDSERMRRTIERIYQRESWLTESDSGQTLQLLGIISEASRENRGRVNVDSLNLQSFSRPVDSDDKTAAKTGEKKKLEQRMQLDLDGSAIDDLAVASFVAMLRDTNVFESVELKSSTAHMRDHHEIRQYELTCIY